MLQDDLAPFFSTAEFADKALLGGAEVLGIFTDASAVGNVGALSMGTTQPVFLLPAASVPQAPVGLVLQVRGVSYRIGDALPDGTGLVELLLERP